MEKLLKPINFKTYLNIFLVFLMLNGLNSCDSTATSSCRWGKEMYGEEWDYTVKRVFRYKKFKATWVIETTSGKELFIRPNQPIVSIAEPGDRLIKLKNSEKTLIIKLDSDYRDTLESRIFSPSCDIEIIHDYKK
jgi:hypothetical protein